MPCSGTIRSGIQRAELNRPKQGCFADAREDDREAAFWRTPLGPVGTVRSPTPERFPDLMTHVVRAQPDVLEQTIIHFTKMLPFLPAGGPEDGQVVDVHY